MTINLNIPDIRELKPRITVFGVGGAGGNAVNNMITAGLQGVDFVVANTDAQALTMSKAERIIQMGVQATEGLGAGSQPDVGRAAAEEVIDEIRDHLSGAHMVFVTAGMGGGTGTGAAPVIAKTARDLGILTVGVVTKPFHFEGQRRMRIADGGITELQKCVDTLLIIPNQNLFRVANEKTTFADAFAMADQVLYSGVACITDLMVKEGLINLDFADVRAVMREMGKAMMGTGEAQGEKRALTRRRSGDLQSADRRCVDEGRARPADLDHRRPRPDALRSRRSGHPHPRGGRSGRQHHRRRDLRREPRRHDPRFGGGDRHRPGVWRNARRRRLRIPGSAELAQRIRADTQRMAERNERTEPARPAGAAVSAAPSPVAAPAVVAEPAPARGPGQRQRLDRIGGQGGDRRGRRGRHDPSARAEAFAVHRPDRERAGARNLKIRNRRHSFRRRRSGCRRARRACRGSTNCRSRRRTKSAPAAASCRKTIIRKSGACRCCSAWPRSALAAASRTSTNRRTSAARRAGRAGAAERLAGRPMPRPAEPRQDSRQELPVSEYAKRPAPAGTRPAWPAEPCA